MKVTIKDIAAIAGVNHSTVSRALNDNHQVSQATTKRIKEIARSLNFEFNSGARSLKSSKTGNIGVVYEGHFDQFGSSLYIDTLFIELRHMLERIDMDTILLEAYHPESGISNLDRLLRQQKVDGFLIVHNAITKKDYESIIDTGLPLVQLHMEPKFFNKDKLDYFISDNIEGGRIATEYLIKKGCKKILTIKPNDSESDEYRQRTMGYKIALETNNIQYSQELVISTDCTYKKGYELFDSIPKIIDNIDGIFFQTDIQAFGFLNAALVKGIDIPGEIKVIGYDDVSVCQSSTPKLTTIHQPKKELAELASSRIMEIINKTSDRTLVQKKLHPELVIRGSS